MAFNVTVSYNASTGSNTAASGSGPAIAVTGTSAAYSGDGAGGGTQTVITFTNSPDLSSVAQYDVLYLNTGSGEKYLFEIVSADNTAKTVTVTVAPDTAINSGSAVNYAIGGKRAGPLRAGDGSTQMDFESAEDRWTFEFDDGTYSLNGDNATYFQVFSSGIFSSGSMGKVIRIQSATEPTDADNCGVIFEWDPSNYLPGTHSTNNKLRFWSWVHMRGIKFYPTTGAGVGIGRSVVFAGLKAFKCCFDSSRLTSRQVFYYGSGDQGTLYFQQCVIDKYGVEAGDGAPIIAINTVYRNNSQPFNRMGASAGVFIGCVFENSAQISNHWNSTRGFMLCVNCTANNGVTDFMTNDRYTPSVGQIMVAQNCAITDQAEYGIQIVNSADWWDHIPYWEQDYNLLNGNVSGNRTYSEAERANELTSAPVFVSETGTIDLRPDTGSPLISNTGDVGENPILVGDT